eukprot:PhM_4_TR17369/c3_g1_i6/m.33530
MVHHEALNFCLLDSFASRVAQKRRQLPLCVDVAEDTAVVLGVTVVVLVPDVQLLQAATGLAHPLLAVVAQVPVVIEHPEPIEERVQLMALDMAERCDMFSKGRMSCRSTSFFSSMPRTRTYHCSGSRKFVSLSSFAASHDVGLGKRDSNGLLVFFRAREELVVLDATCWELRGSRLRLAGNVGAVVVVSFGVVILVILIVAEFHGLSSTRGGVGAIDVALDYVVIEEVVLQLAGTRAGTVCREARAKQKPTKHSPWRRSPCTTSDLAVGRNP